MLSLLALNVNAAVVYNFEGICISGCSGVSTGVLTLTDSYTPETQVTDADFISFSYSSSSGSFNIPADLALNRFNMGVLPASSGPSIEWVEIDAVLSNTSLHACGPAGAPAEFCPSDNYWSALWRSAGVYDDKGLSHTWTLVDAGTVPIPAAVWLFGSGIIGLIGVARRKA